MRFWSRKSLDGLYFFDIFVFLKTTSTSPFHSEELTAGRFSPFE